MAFDGARLASGAATPDVVGAREPVLELFRTALAGLHEELTGIS